MTSRRGMGASDGRMEWRLADPSRALMRKYSRGEVVSACVVRSVAVGRVRRRWFSQWLPSIRVVPEARVQPVLAAGCVRIVDAGRGGV